MPANAQLIDVEVGGTYRYLPPTRLDQAPLPEQPVIVMEHSLARTGLNNVQVVALAHDLPRAALEHGETRTTALAHLMGVWPGTELPSEQRRRKARERRAVEQVREAAARAWSAGATPAGLALDLDE